MANMTGPMAKGTHSGGKTFTPKVGQSGGSMPKLTNRAEDARSAIMGLRMQSGSFGTNIEQAMKNPRRD